MSIAASLTGISQALQAAFPDLSLPGLRIVEVGFGSTVIGTSHGIIIRIGRTAAAARGHAVPRRAAPDRHRHARAVLDWEMVAIADPA
jgi:hypothetical protein